eukprot:COSAG01_NODE_13441_length_1585_cov_1.137954_1_plen_48_part_10
MEYAAGDWFGELALLGGPDSRRAATVTAAGSSSTPTRCLQLPRSSFQH